MKRFINCSLSLLITLFFSGSVASCKERMAGKTVQEQKPTDQSGSPAVVRGFMMPEKNSQKNFDDVKAWGANVVRIQIFPARYAQGKGQDTWSGLPSYLDQLELQLQSARTAGLKVVIDLHEAPIQNVVAQEADFWKRTDLEENFCRMWTEISKRFLPYRDAIWGYDIYNEPVDRSQYPASPVQYRPIAIKIVEAIRKIDKSTWIIFEPGPWGNTIGFKGLEPLPDNRIIYSFHFYTPQSSFTHQGVHAKDITLEEGAKKFTNTYPSVMDGTFWDKSKLEEDLKYVDEFQAKYKVPIYVGEFSVIRWAPKEGAVNWLKDVIALFEARGWSWSYHAFREWHGWSLEHDEQFWLDGMPNPQPVTYDTERAKVVKAAFLKNK